jgi:dTDP-4-amino-4,6-dideoxygalactose transaminase
MDINAVRKTLAASPGKYAGIVTVDFAGNAVNLEELRSLADEYGLWIIEDACHAPGGFFIDSKKEKQFCGNGRYAELAIFSFHPVKHITTGEGGMITTNNADLYKKLLELRSHGITRDPMKFINDKTWAAGNAVESPANYPGWYMEMQELGYNYRLTDFQSALGISQLKRAGKNLKRRREIAKKYEKAFKGKKWLIGQSGYVEGHAYHLYIIETENRLGLYDHLRSKNIFPQVHYIPTHLMPFYKSKDLKLPHAEKYYSQCLSLPMFATLTSSEQETVIKEINRFFNG